MIRPKDVKIPLFGKFQCPRSFGTQESNVQRFVMAAILEFKMAATRFIRHFKLIHCWTQHVKIPLFSKFQCHRSFGTHDSNVQRFVMAAILEFKMAADPLIRRLGFGNFWTQHVKIPLFTKFQCHRSFGNQDGNVQRFVMAAILEFKIAANPLVRLLGSDNLWTQHVKIPLYAKLHTFCRMWTCNAQNWKFHCLMAFRTQDSNDQCLVMAAILEFKMAATRFVIHYKLIYCWTQHVKIPLFSKFQCHRSFGTHDSNVQRVVMVAILEFKMAADPLVRPLGSGNFWTQHVKIPLYAKFHTFCQMWTCTELKISVPYGI